MEIDVLFTPGHSPGHVTYAPRAANAIFSGDVLFQSSIGRTDLPGGDHAQLLATIAELIDRFDDETRVLPGHMGVTTLGAERAEQPVPRRARPRLVAWRGRSRPREGTFDVLPEEAAGARARGGRRRGRSSSRRATAASRRPSSRRPSSSRAASASPPTSSRRRCTPSRTAAGGRSRCGPRARRRSAAPTSSTGCTSSRSPAKLWYLSSFFRYERAQAGRYRQFWQIGRRGDRHRRPGRRRRAHHAAQRRLLDELEVRRAAPAASARSAQPQARSAVPRGAHGAPARP